MLFFLIIFLFTSTWSVYNSTFFLATLTINCSPISLAESSCGCKNSCDWSVLCAHIYNYKDLWNVVPLQLLFIKMILSGRATKLTFRRPLLSTKRYACSTYKTPNQPVHTLFQISWQRRQCAAFETFSCSYSLKILIIFNSTSNFHTETNVERTA